MNERRNQRRRRRVHNRPEIDYSVPSPCQAVCTFDGEPFCKGCLRNADEIRDWMIMNREQKLTVLDNIKKRRAELISG